MISLIIRTKNEEQYLDRCLAAVNWQRFVDLEIIVVDNESEDKSVEIATRHGAKVVPISSDEWSYGRAINKGIENSCGDYLVCLSGHCIPVNQSWLYHLTSGFLDDSIAGVYGRQEPILSTPVIDKRDMWNTLGVERRVQTKDPFFHNANSIIRRSVWEQFPFDETVSGVEDRIWAREILAHGYKIVYEPLASVYHPHGLNQGADPKRAARVVQVIEEHMLHTKAK